MINSIFVSLNLKSDADDFPHFASNLLLIGCECPKGQLMDDNGSCSPPDSCPCYDSNGKQRPFNSSYTDEKTCQTW